MLSAISLSVIIQSVVMSTVAAPAEGLRFEMKRQKLGNFVSCLTKEREKERERGREREREGERGRERHGEEREK